ncbi:MAG: CYTH domain-containing protein [Bacteroidetes bacterium]|nr:CYTH domain-containing protein [Bacteroidota bacterium]
MKAWAPSEDRLTQLLSEFKKEGIEKFQEDVYFDTEQKDLFKHGVFIRIRNGKLAEIKYNPNKSDSSHLDCEETRFELPFTLSGISALRVFLEQLGISDKGIINQDDSLSVLKSFGLYTFVTISKKRTVYTKPGVEFCIDFVEDLGRFIEIESVNQELSNSYQKWANNEGIKPIPVGYVELYLRQHDFPTYLTGRYILDEDRKQP